MTAVVEAPAVPVTPAKKRRPRRDWRAIGAFAVLTGPVVLGLGLFKYVAIGWSFLLSFNDARGTITLGHWIGFGNYAFLLGDDAFLTSLSTIAIFTVFIVPITFVASLGLAVLINSIRRGRAFFRTVFLIPAAVSYVVAALVWKMALFNGLPSGVANVVGGMFGADPVPWLSTTSPPVYWVAVVTLRLWLQVGLYMILFMAGLQAIPPSLYEAGELDGTTKWQAFRYITLPQLRNTSVAVLLLILIAAFQAFDEFYNLFGTGLSGTATAPVKPPLVYLYDSALGDQNYGVGSAGAFLLTVLIIVITLLQGRFVGFGKKD
ncbi:sugar ABC transporter permease [Amycolatopsis sp. NPDC051716]|uniref:carbohydrate ABC transporter permease n=1 Tax=Amycolatopsis sp. NPDC051716 TaxID=3155804 RepID=UPI0034447C42